MQPIKIVGPDSGVHRLGPRYCGADKCSNATREGKPFCSTHVSHNPYARQIIDELKAQEEEDRKASRCKYATQANVDGITATAVLQHVSFYGPRTKERLCRELNITMQVLNAYVRALLKVGKVTVTHSKRGPEVVALADGQ